MSSLLDFLDFFIIPSKVFYKYKIMENLYIYPIYGCVHISYLASYKGVYAPNSMFLCAFLDCWQIAWIAVMQNI